VLSPRLWPGNRLQSGNILQRKESKTTEEKKFTSSSISIIIHGRGQYRADAMDGNGVKHHDNRERFLGDGGQGQFLPSTQCWSIVASANPTSLQYAPQILASIGFSSMVTLRTQPAGACTGWCIPGTAAAADSLYDVPGGSALVWSTSDTARMGIAPSNGV